MVAGNFGRLDRPELLRRSPHVPVRGLHKRRVDGVPLWTFHPLPGRGDQYPAAHQCPGQYFLFDVPRAQCGGGHWERLELGHRGGSGHHRGCLSRPRRPAGRGLHRRHTKYGNGGGLPGGVGGGVVEYGWLGRLEPAAGFHRRGPAGHPSARRRVLAARGLAPDGDIWFRGGADNLRSDKPV